MIELHYDIPGDDFTRAGEASSAVKKILKQTGMPAAIIRRASIAMYEGEINLVIHAGGGQMDVTIGPKIDITLTDNGPGIPDIELAMQEGYSTASPGAVELGFGAGMGLSNMKKNTDTMTVDSVPGRGTTVHMTINVIQAGGC